MTETMNQTKNTPVEKSFAVPPDVIAARKARMNYDLISMLNTASPLNTNSPMKGIGLFTHISLCSSQDQSDGEQVDDTAVFLPIGGPAKTRRKARTKAQIPDDIQATWDEFQAVMTEEEVATANMSIKELKQRFGDTDQSEDIVAKTQAQLIHMQLPETTVQPSSENTSLPPTHATPGWSGRRLPWSKNDQTATQASGDVAMSAIEPGRGEITTQSGSLYEPARDPRLRGRRKYTE